MTNVIEIAGRRIGRSEPPYIIAEMSANHNGSLDTAYKIMEEAKAAGADAIKIQTYTPDTITIDCDSDDFKIQGGLWDGKTLYELYDWAHTPWEWHRPMFEYAEKLGITIFSSPFDFTAVDFLEDLNAPAYKIASFEAIDIPLIRYVASTGKPMIISTGMSDKQEIDDAISAALDGGCKQLAILHCVSGYPAPPEDYNLRTLADIHDRYGLTTGLSDHTLGNLTAIASIAIGASIVEKHFTLDRAGGGPDDSFSLEPPELTDLCNNAATVWRALGKIDYGRKSSELGNVIFRRSLYAVEDIQVGEVFSLSNVRSIRPGYGLPPRLLPKVIGKAALCNISRGTPLDLDFIES